MTIRRRPKAEGREGRPEGTFEASGNASATATGKAHVRYRAPRSPSARLNRPMAHPERGTPENKSKHAGSRHQSAFNVERSSKWLARGDRAQGTGSHGYRLRPRNGRAGFLGLALALPEEGRFEAVALDDGTLLDKQADSCGF